MVSVHVIVDNDAIKSAKTDEGGLKVVGRCEDAGAPSISSVRGGTYDPIDKGRSFQTSVDFK